MNRTAALLAMLVAAAAGCGHDDAAKQPLPPPISLGPPPGPGPGMGTVPPPVAAPNPHAAPAVPARFKPPEGWQTEAPSSNMRVAQFRIPRADGDPKDGEVAVFGNIMGTTKANIDRWRGQFTEVAQGKDSLEEITAGLRGKVTLLDITGNFGGGMAPGAGGGMASAHGVAEEGTTRMLGAVIEATDGTFYVKALGPPATMAKWEASIRAFILATAK